MPAIPWAIPWAILWAVLWAVLVPVAHADSGQASPTPPTAAEIADATADDAVGEDEAALPFTENDVAERDRELVVCDPNAPRSRAPG